MRREQPQPDPPPGEQWRARWCIPGTKLGSSSTRDSGCRRRHLTDNTRRAVDYRHVVHRPSGGAIQGDAKGHALRSIVLVLEHVEDDMRYERIASQVRKSPAAEENALFDQTLFITVPAL